MKFGIVGRIDDGFFRYQGWPTICKDENGVLYVASSGHRLTHICPFGKNLMYVSHDEGKTWSAPAIINDTVLDDRDAGLLSLGNGKLLMTYFNHPWEYYNREYVQKRSRSEVSDTQWGLFCGMMKGYESMPDEENHAGSFIRISEDSGKTWGKSIKVPITAPHGPIKLANGKLLYLGKSFHDENYEEKKIYAFESDDEGQTWRCLTKIEVPTSCMICEPYALELPDGRILGAIRVEDRPFTIFMCESLDGGRTWSIPQPTGFCGAPPHLMLHSSGAVVLSYGRREAPYGQRARVSYDGGRTFGEEIVISEEAKDADIGYPSTVELSDGKLFTTYYQSYPGDDFTSILYTEWELPQPN